VTTICGGGCGATSAALVAAGFAFKADPADLPDGWPPNWANAAIGDRATARISANACRLNIKRSIQRRMAGF
jgi:hypothetical protein